MAPPAFGGDKGMTSAHPQCRTAAYDVIAGMAFAQVDYEQVEDERPWPMGATILFAFSTSLAFWIVLAGAIFECV
jgi:hypothetical protein